MIDCSSSCHVSCCNSCIISFFLFLFVNNRIHWIYLTIKHYNFFSFFVSVSPTPIPQQFPHPSSTLHPHPQHPQHPQPSATPTGQPQQGNQHGGSHPAPSPVQHSQHQAAAQAMHLGNPPQQQMYSALAPTPPSMTPGPNPQSPQASFPSAQQTVYIHPQQVQHGYNHNHMAHVQQVSANEPDTRIIKIQKILKGY